MYTIWEAKEEVMQILCYVMPWAALAFDRSIYLPAPIGVQEIYDQVPEGRPRAGIKPNNVLANSIKART